MTAKTSKTDALKGIYLLTRRAYRGTFNQVVDQFKPLFIQRMAHKKINHPLKAVAPLIRHMVERKQDPSLIIAVGYYLCSKEQRRVKL